MSTVTSPTAHTLNDDQAHRASRRLVIAAVSIPVMVIGQFAMLAVIPVTIVVRTTWRHPHLRPLRAWAVGLAAVYATPLALWAIGPDRAPSLSQDMAAPLATLIVAGSSAFVARHLASGRASRS
ncbi:hypothetical protein [Nocardioides sp. URHA0020]|uniref:hypothetical protein n=1 Tax=Nocardioides sp. URHA0020 TaxID=1380392 RepID=UPI0006853D16|nr:hypothetical protein [Nocardioides sp. URHA0020]